MTGIERAVPFGLMLLAASCVLLAGCGSDDGAGSVTPAGTLATDIAPDTAVSDTPDVA
ncbi:MAG: hypothetical protein ACI9WU_004483, partial [Myxococcota bacterium]